MSVQLQEIIDNENLILDAQKLTEHNNRLHKKLDEIRDRFIEENYVEDDFNATTLIYRLIQEIKNSF